MQRPPISDRGADPGLWIRGADTPTGCTEPIIPTTTATLYEEVGSEFYIHVKVVVAPYETTVVV